MSSRFKVPRGTFDILPADSRARARLEAAAQQIFQRAGYERIETPTFESTDLFARGVGAATDIVQKEMYTFEDGGGRSLTLRPEGTAPVCRSYLEHGMHRLPQPVKLWYCGSFYRYERAQAGRYRQFWQVGAEVIGAADPAVDAELILLLRELLEAVGVRQTELLLSSLGRPDTRACYRAELQEYLRAHADQLAAEVRARIELNPMRAFDSDDPSTRAVLADAPRLIDQLDGEDEEHFNAVRALLDAAGVPYTIDSTLVRGLDYYTRTVFEFSSSALGAQSGVGGGGRYDGLLAELGGQSTPAAGWAAGVERMLLAAGDVQDQLPQLDLYVAYTDPALRGAAFALCTQVRAAGKAAQMELAGRGLKGQFKQADRLRAITVAIVENEKSVTLKRMNSGEQETIGVDEALSVLTGS